MIRTKQLIGVCFFFQAEDGIRDGRVTGVQTCALPICRLEDAGEHRSQPGPDVRGHYQRVHGDLGDRVDGAGPRERAAAGSNHHFLQDVAPPRSDCGVPRPREADRSAAASRSDRGGNGNQRAGLVGVGDGCSAARRDWRHHPGVADAASELLQALGLRAFAPSVTACPGCGRTTSTTFQELAERVQEYVRNKMPEWKATREGVESLTLAVMGCVVNGPGESKAANIGISLPGTGEAPACPIYIDGEHVTTLRGTYEELAGEFQRLIDQYVEQKY